jgi:hypothetical protein
MVVIKFCTLGGQGRIVDAILTDGARKKSRKVV